VKQIKTHTQTGEHSWRNSWVVLQKKMGNACICSGKTFAEWFIYRWQLRNTM